MPKIEAEQFFSLEFEAWGTTLKIVQIVVGRMTALKFFTNGAIYAHSFTKVTPHLF